MDLAAEYSVPLPMMVIAEMIGMPVADWPLFNHWSGVILKLSYTRSGGEEAATALSEFRTVAAAMHAYLADNQRHRIGPNFQQLTVNRPLSSRNCYNQNGAMSMRAAAGDVNYQPSTRDQVTYVDTPSQLYSTRKLSGATLQHAISKQNNFGQAGAAYMAMSENDRAHLIENLSGDLKQVTNRAIQVKMISHFYRANAEYGTRLAKSIGVPLADVQAASN